MTIERHTPFRAMVAGLAALGPVTLRGQEYKGEYLSTLVAVNPEQPAEEAARTSQLIAEFGRLTAAALKDKEMADVDYRIWRSKVVTELTTDLEACVKQGLLPAEAKKPLSKTAADEALKQLPDYQVHYEAMKTAEETHGVLYAAYEAAKARQYAIRAFEASGGTDYRQTGQTSTPEVAHSYHGGHIEDRTTSLEQKAAGGSRTPLPEAGPPGPPPFSDQQGKPAKAKKAPPPPPSPARN